MGRVLRSLSSVRGEMSEGSLLLRLEAFVKEAARPPSGFGRAALRDPCCVSDLRGGRQPGREIIGRADHFMNKWRDDSRVGDVAPLGERRTSAFWRRDEGSDT